jgi:hypothetical protein
MGELPAAGEKILVRDIITRNKSSSALTNTAL